MVFAEGLVEEFDVPADAQPVGKDTELGGVTEMPVDILTPGIGVCTRGFGKQGIDRFIGIVVGIVFNELFGLPEFRKEKFWIVLFNGQFDAGGVIDEVIGQFLADFSADRFGKLDELVEQLLKVVGIDFPEAGQFRGIGDFMEAAEVSEFVAATEDGKQKGVRGNAKEFL